MATPAFVPCSPFPPSRFQRPRSTCPQRRTAILASAESPSSSSPSPRPGDEPVESANSGAAPSEPSQSAGKAPKKPIDGHMIVEALRKSGLSSSALANPGFLKASHELVVCDGTEPARFVYVEERDCIGCTHCATTARGTFYMEEDNGRARAYNQTGDSNRVVEEAIDTCPVNCIYYTTFEDLVILEKEREGQHINNYTRLVGGSDPSASVNRSTASINTSGIMRCTDCPHRGCAECPLYGVGENPVYLQRVAQREAKRRKRAGGDGSSDSDEHMGNEI